MFKTPFAFDGRIRRTEYALSLLLYFIGYAAIVVLITRMGRVGFFAGWFTLLTALWFIVAQGAKRCHDFDKSGWWQLIPLFSLWMLFVEGNKETNKYGENPRTVSRAIHLPTQSIDTKDETRDENEADGPPR